MPRINPPAAGNQPGIPAACASSIAGMSKLQTDAAIMTPAANPRNIFCIPTLTSFLKKKTIAAPKVVIRKVKPVPVIAHPIACIISISSFQII